MPRFTDPIRVIHVDKDPDVRAHIANQLKASDYPKFEVLSVERLDDLNKPAARKIKPDVVLIDTGACHGDLSPEAQYKLFRDTMLRFTKAPMILLSADALDLDRIYDLVVAGADNIFIKRPSPTSNDVPPCLYCPSGLNTLVVFVVKAIARASRRANTLIDDTWKLLTEVRDVCREEGCETGEHESCVR